jgi:exonuclease VII small subunit
MQELNIAVQQLNSAESLESAMDYFENLAQLYNWDLENQTVKRLLDLVDRRYSA